MICNVCDLPILEGAAARAVFSGGQAVEQVPTDVRLGAVTREPTFDGTGLGGANPTSPGWYPDPDPRKLERFERYWDGEAWGPDWDRRPRVEPLSSKEVARRFLLACVLPFALSLLLPYLVGQWADPQMSAVGWLGWLLLAGWGPYLVGLAGLAIVGEYRVEPVDQPRADGWEKLAGVLAWALGIWGLLATVGLLFVYVLASALAPGLTGL